MRCPNCRIENPPRAEHCSCGYDFPPGLMTGSYLTAPEIYAGDVAAVASTYHSTMIAHRFGALVIDCAVVAAMLAYPYRILGLQRVWPLAAFLCSLYFVVLEGRWGATLGKLAMRLRVVDGRGRPPGYLPALVRMVLRLIELNPLVGGIPAGLVALFSVSKQRMGDMLAGTYVLYVEDVRRVRGTGPMPAAPSASR